MESCWKAFQDTLVMVITSIGFAVYAIILAVLIRYSKTTFRNPFFTLCISLGIVEIAGIVESIVRPTINTYMRNNPDDKVFPGVYGCIARMAWYGVLFHQVYIAMERMTALMYPKVWEKIWSKKWFCLHYTVITILTLATNVCVATEYCPYELYPDGETNFYNLTSIGGQLHNKIVDMGIQPGLMVLVISMYLISGWKVVKVRKQIRANMGMNSDGKNRKRRIEIALVLQGFLVSTPQIITAIFYHLIIYLELSYTAFIIVNFLCAVAQKFVYTLSPFLYFFFNNDIKTKLAEMVVGNKEIKQSATSGGALTTIRRRETTVYPKI